MAKDGKRWCKKLNRYESRPDVDAFLKDVSAVCELHGMAIEHEDGHGAFIVTKWCGRSNLEHAHVDAELEPTST